MASAVKDLRSLPLFQIIGAPMLAVVQAEAQAARTTLEYLQQVGFIPPTNGADGSTGTQETLGQLRMTEFSYTKPDANGNEAQFRAHVPLLSLVPIPGIRVKQAKVGFTAKITDAYQEDTTTRTANSGKGGLWLRSNLTQFRGSLAPAPSKGQERVRGSYELNIEIELEQMPIAPGLEKILATLDQAINDHQDGNA